MKNQNANMSREEYNKFQAKQVANVENKEMETFYFVRQPDHMIECSDNFTGSEDVSIIKQKHKIFKTKEEALAYQRELGIGTEADRKCLNKWFAEEGMAEEYGYIKRPSLSIEQLAPDMQLLEEVYVQTSVMATGVVLPKGYQFKDENGNVINATKIVLEKNIIREEQIDNAAQEYIDSDNAVLTYSDGFCEQTDHPFVRAAFKAGVEWADNNVTQDDCSKAPKLTSQDYSNGRFGYRLPAGFKAKLTESELILTPEKPEYPKSLLDCENVLNGVRNDRKKLLHKFNELLICRDAYWKIAGEEMGLGEPWKPDYTDPDQDRYAIVNFMGNIEKSKWDYGYSITFVFPTEEMRDAFRENFDPDIEICKELL